MCSPIKEYGFLRRSGLKTSVDFTHFGLESGMVFEGTTGVKNVFVVSIPNKKGRKRLICESEMAFKKSLCWRSNLSK